MTREEVENLIRFDTANCCPECTEETTMIFDGREGFHCADEKGGVITRYYEDEETARAYSLASYSSGFCIIYDKPTESYFTAVLGEDDGAWFLVDYPWTIFNKSEFICVMSEALNIFNANFEQPKKEKYGRKRN